MTATNQTNNGITLEVNMYQFINEFIADARPGLNQQESQFTYSLFRDFVHAGLPESIEVVHEDGTVNTLADYDWRQDFYTEYGLLRDVYECDKPTVNVRERDNDTTGNKSYWKYTATLINNEKFVQIQFYTRWRITEFAEYEAEMEQNEIAEQLEHLNDKTVLCLESEPALFKRAAVEIEEAIEMGYYGDIDDFEYPNLAEVIDDWMKYHCRGSHKFVNEIVGGGTQLVITATERAFKWYVDGINLGLIHNEINK